MNPILQGSLSHFTAADVLTLLAARMQSGTIDFESEGTRARVVLRDGKIAGTDGSDAVSTVFAVCYWPGGTFSLVHDMLLGEGVTPADYEVGALLDEVARRAAEEKAEAERYNDNVTFRVIDNADAQEQLGLTSDELKLLIRIGLGRKFADLIGTRDRKDFIKTLKRLEAGEVIERVSGEKGETPWKGEADAPKEQARSAPPSHPKARAPEPSPKQQSKPQPKAEPKGQPKPEAKPDPRPAAAKPNAAAEATQMLRPERTAGRRLMASLTADNGSAFPLLDDEVFIGRASTNTISLNDSSISTRHARISLTADGFFLEDLKSRNGTFVNGEQVTEKRMLSDNDTVRLGKVVFTFNVATELTPGDTTAGVG